MNKAVIISGSNGGIGSALVKTYLKDGFIVIGIDKTESNIENSHNKFFFFKNDLELFVKSKTNQNLLISKLKKYLPEKLNELVIINNAAFQFIAPFNKVSPSDFEKSLSINTIAPFFIVKNFFDELKQATGHVINVSSIHAKQTKSFFSVYAASKAALDSVTRSLAIGIPHGISVNSVSPAAIMTNMLRDGFNGDNKKINDLEKYHPSGKIATAEELALFIKTITDYKGKFLTGSIIEFNGGIACKLNDPQE